MGITISDLSKPTNINTSIGPILITHLGLHDIINIEKSLSNINNEQLGKITLKTLISSPENFEELLTQLKEPELKHLILSAAQKVNKNTSSASTLSDLGEITRKLVESIRQQKMAAFETIKGGIDNSTYSSIFKSSFGLDSATKKLSDLASATPKSIDQILESINKAERIPSIQPLPQAPNLSSPIMEKFDELSKGFAEMGASLGELNQAVMTKALPEFLNNIEQGRSSQARSIQVAVISIVVSAVITIGVAIWQTWSSMESSKSIDTQNAAILKALSNQLEEARHNTKTLISTLEESQKSDTQLNKSLIEQAIKNGKTLRTLEKQIHNIHPQDPEP